MGRLVMITAAVCIFLTLLFQSTPFTIKKLFVLLLFIPVCFTALSQATNNRESTPASGCGAITMILRHPENTIVCPGSNAVFISEVNYRQYGLATWQQSIDNGNTWHPVSEPYLQSGDNFTTDTLLILSASDAVANRLYRAVYSQPCSSYIKILSAPAKLMVGIQPLQLLQQPLSQSVCVGNSAAFTVRAAGNSLSYQWQLSTDHGNTFQYIAESIQPALQLPGVTIAQNGYLYRCIISSGCAGTVTSDAAALTVHPSSVSITAQPTDEQICYGSPATLSVAASGASVNYQWQKSYDGVNYFNIEHSDSAVLEIPWISEGANLYNRFRWNGSVSNDWADPKNWNCGYVPSGYDEVIIPTGVSPSPEIRNHQAVARLSVFNNGNITILQGIIFRIVGYPKY